jgi:hypothetical protein
MTVWGVGCMQWLGGALDRNNLEASEDSDDYDLATEATPDGSLCATAVHGKPVAEIAMGETVVRLARCKATDAEKHSPATLADGSSPAGQLRTKRDSNAFRR